MNVLHVLCDRILGNSLLDEPQACRGPFAHGSSGFTPPPGNKVTTSASSRESRCSTSQGLLYHRAAVAIQQPETWFGQYAWIFQIDSDRRLNVSDIQQSQGNEQEVSTHPMT